MREFADLIPGARLREIPGDAAVVFAVDVELVADIVEEFITGAPPPARTDRILATVLFTDIVDSTKRVARSGDRAWAALLERHLAATGTAISGHGGEMIKSTGDGVLALFTGPAQGVRCARQIITDASELSLDVRTGLHPARSNAPATTSLASLFTSRPASPASPMRVRPSSHQPSATSSLEAN